MTGDWRGPSNDMFVMLAITRLITAMSTYQIARPPEGRDRHIRTDRHVLGQSLTSDPTMGRFCGFLAGLVETNSLREPFVASVESIHRGSRSGSTKRQPSYRNG